jgi:lipopolysaccharide export system permease protein
MLGWQARCTTSDEVIVTCWSRLPKRIGVSRATNPRYGRWQICARTLSRAVTRDDENLLKTLHLYLTRQVLGSLLMTVGVFTGVLLLGNVLRELLALLVNRQATAGMVVEAVGLLIPFVLVFALPMGMLTATLLIFGRFSAEQELTAARASGISLVSMVSPILLLSLALCAVSAWVNMEIAPSCRVAYTGLISRLKLELANAQLPEGRFVNNLPPYIFYVGKNRGGHLRDIIVFKLENGTNVVWSVHAPSGNVDVDTAARKVLVHLHDAKAIRDNGDVSTFDVTLTLDMNPIHKSVPEISDMTFSQLWDLWDELDNQFRMPNSMKGLSPAVVSARQREWERNRDKLASHIRFEIHRQVAFSFACFGFTLVGIPLGIRVHRRESNVGFAIALLLVAVYYGFLLIGQSLEDKPQYVPYLILWLPNFLFEAVGAVLLWKANRGI